MAQLQFASGDTIKWSEKYGDKSDGVGSINTSTFAEANETFLGTITEYTGTAGGTSLQNNDCVWIWQTQGTGTGNHQLNKVVSGGGTTSLTFKYPLTNIYATGAQILKLKRYSSLAVNTGQTWTSSAWDGSKGGIIACLVNGDITVTGNILLTGRGFRGGPQSGQGENPGYAGDGSVGNYTRQNAANGNGGGGSAGDTGSVGGGGGGGYAVAGTDGQTLNGTGGKGGLQVGIASLITLFPGGGGGGACAKNEAGMYGGAGGNGGGILFLIGKTITVTGSILCNGNVGSNGPSTGGSGGGGAGGSIFLKGQTIVLGTNLLTSSAGSGGTSGGGNGGAGAVGRIHADYLTSITGTTTPTLDSTQDSTLATGGGTFLPFL
jgi:hypothetical protein